MKRCLNSLDMLLYISVLTHYVYKHSKHIKKFLTSLAIFLVDRDPFYLRGQTLLFRTGVWGFCSPGGLRGALEL